MIHSSLHSFLKSTRPFQTLSDADVEKLISFIQEKFFERGDNIYNEGDEADSIWLVYSGRIQIFKSTVGLKSFAVESLGPRELFGTFCRLGQFQKKYPCTATAATTSVVLRLSDKIFQQYCSAQALAMQDLCSLCSDRLKTIQEMRCLGQAPAEARLASILVKLHQTYGETLPFTKKEISELAGLTIETTFRISTVFQKKRWIFSRRGQIQILQVQSLQSLFE